MAKLAAPLLSFSAAGQIGNAQVYSKWKGVPYARRYVIPANPNSSGQQSTRNTFSWLNSVFKFAGPFLQAPWTAYAKGKPLTDRNALIQSNLPLLRGAANPDDFVGSPGANGGIVATSISAADGGSQVANVTLGVPSVPTDWTITDSIAVLIPAWTDITTADGTTYEGHSGDATGSVDVTGVAGNMVVVGWFEMTKPDGTTAYGPSLGTTLTLA